MKYTILQYSYFSKGVKDLLDKQNTILKILLGYLLPVNWLQRSNVKKIIQNLAMITSDNYQGKCCLN